MKKLLLLLLIAPMIGNSQQTDIYDLNINGLNFIGDEWLITFNHFSPNTEITIPDNEHWYIFNDDAEIYILIPELVNYGYINFYTDTNFVEKPWSGSNEEYNHFNPVTNLISGGSKFYFEDWEETATPSDESCSDCAVRVFKYETTKFQNSLSFNENPTENNLFRPTLYPNPTSSLLALNSDKEYDIEVYDMAGNKVMALTGNTVDMSHLSSATYIIKALDKVENEEVSYKVVKN